MSEELIEIEGIEEVLRDLTSASPAVAGVGVTLVLNAAAKVIQDAIRARTPVRAVRVGGDAEYPSLIQTLKSKVTIDSNYRGGIAEVGFWKQSYVAEWLEYGHRIVGHGKSKEARVVHGMVAPHPFMRPAAEAATERAV
jgi:hypothetical protein